MTFAVLDRQLKLGNFKQESRAIAGRTARCRCKLRYVSNFTTASYVRFSCNITAFLLIFADCQKVISRLLERTSQIAYLTQTSTSHDHSQLLPSTVIISRRQRNDSRLMSRTRKGRCEKESTTCATASFLRSHAADSGTALQGILAMPPTHDQLCL